MARGFLVHACTTNAHRSAHGRRRERRTDCPARLQARSSPYETKAPRRPPLSPGARTPSRHWHNIMCMPPQDPDASVRGSPWQAGLSLPCASHGCPGCRRLWQLGRGKTPRRGSPGRPKCLQASRVEVLTGPTWFQLWQLVLKVSSDRLWQLARQKTWLAEALQLGCHAAWRGSRSRPLRQSNPPPLPTPAPCRVW